MTFICVIPLTVVRGSNFDTCKTVGNPVQETMLNVKVLNWGFLKAENFDFNPNIGTCRRQKLYLVSNTS